MILFQRQRRTPASAPTSQPAAASSSREIRLELTHPAHPHLIDTLHTVPDACTTFVRGADWWVWAATPVGLDCFPDLTTLVSPSRPLEAILTGLEDLSPVAFVAGCQRTGAMYFGRSFEGATSLLFAEGDERLVIGDARLTVAQAIGEVRLSDADQRVWCESLMLDPEGSFYDGVKRCFAGVRYRVAPGSLAIEDRRLMAPESRVRADVDPVDILTEGLRQVFATYGNRKVALRLSGGADSRVLLVGLMDAVEQGILHRDQVLCTSVVFPGMDCDESEAIARITELAGFEWAPIAATADNVRRAHELSLDLPAPPFPTSFMGMLCADVAQNREVDLVLSGHGGDEIFSFQLLDLLGAPLIQRLSNMTAIREASGKNSRWSWLKSVARVLAGLELAPSVHRVLRQHHLPASSLHTYRLGRRMGLAKGCGYEMAVATNTSYNLRTDLPLFRGQLLSTLDPARYTQANRSQPKSIAHAYLHSRAHRIKTVECKKVRFDQPVIQYLSPPHSNRDPVDEHSAVLYVTSVACHRWRAGLTGS